MNTNKKEQRANINEGFLRGREKEQPTEPELAPITKDIVLAPIEKNTVPDNFHLMRTFAKQYAQIENEFFAKALSKYKSVSFDEGDLCSLMFAIGQKLYNDSYSTGRGNKMNIGRALTKEDDVFIDITLAYIKQKGYGVRQNNEKHRKEILELIDALHDIPLVTLDAEGTGEMRYLLTKSVVKIKKFKTQRFKLRVDKVMCDTSQGFGVFPQDTMERLVREGGGKADKKLLLYLGVQSKKTYHYDKIENLMLKMWREEKVKKNIKRYSGNLGAILERLKRVGIIYDYEINKKLKTIFFFFSKAQLETYKSEVQKNPSFFPENEVQVQ